MRTLKFFKLAAALAFAMLAGACAHPISLTTGTTPTRVESQLINKRVAYAISETDRAKQVVTPGGGGDKVSYFPYRDLEKSIRDVLRTIYTDVVAVKSATDAQGINEASATLVFTPVLTTTSSSPSPFTWPPTIFVTQLSCVVTDATGKQITQFSLTGNGSAEFGEFKSDFSLAAKRATDDLTTKLAAEIRSNDKLR